MDESYDVILSPNDRKAICNLCSRILGPNNEITSIYTQHRNITERDLRYISQTLITSINTIINVLIEICVSTEITTCKYAYPAKNIIDVFENLCHDQDVLVSIASGDNLIISKWNSMGE